MKIAILGVENSHADAFGQLVKENPKYTDIEILLIEKSMLKEGQILKHVIKPLIAEGKIIKLNEVSSVRNFKDDSYKVGDL